MTALVWDIQGEFTAGNWTSIKADTVTVSPVEWGHGTQGSDPQSVRVAATGMLTFALDNSARNSGSLLGYYSPNNANCRAGFGLGMYVRTSVTDGGVTMYWQYKIIDISPVAGQYGERYTMVTCVDYIDELASRTVSQIAVQVNKLSSQLYTTIVANLPNAPANTSYTAGAYNLHYCLHDLRDESTTALNAIAKVAASSMDYVFVKGDTTDGETLTSETLHKRLLRTAVTASFSNTMNGLVIKYNKDLIYNRVRLTSHPVQLDTHPDTVLATIQREFSIPAGSTLPAFIMRYRDPTGAGRRVSGIDMQTPVNGTDYRMTAFTGSVQNDLGADLALTVTFGANSASVIAQNTGATPGWASLTSQPAEAAANDTYIESDNTTTNYGTETVLKVGDDGSPSGDVYRALIKFDLSSIPATAIVMSAVLSLYVKTDGSTNPRIVRAYRVLKNWVETEATWAKYSTAGGNWTSAGCSGSGTDREATDIGTAYVTATETAGTEIQFNLTAAKVTDWVDSTLANYGLLIKADTEVSDLYDYDSSGSVTTTERPKLVVTYMDAPGRGYVNFLQLRGRGAYLYDPIETISSDATSITAYGARELSLDMPYQDNSNVSQDIADWLLAQYKDPRTQIDSITFIANTSSTLMGYARALEIGSRITVVETVTGLSGDYYVNNIKWSVQPGNILYVTLGALEPAIDISDWMILDTGKLDINVLGA